MQDITVDELKQKLDNKEELLFIDVREQWEYDDFNLGAKLIPLGSLPDAITEFDLWREKEVIVQLLESGTSI